MKYWHIIIYMYQKIAATTTPRFVAAKSWKRKKIDLQHTIYRNSIPLPNNVCKCMLQLPKDEEEEKRAERRKEYAMKRDTSVAATKYCLM